VTEATVERARSETTRPPANDAAPDAAQSAISALPSWRAALWLGIALVTVAFIAFGSIEIGAGAWIGRRLPVREIWSRFNRFLLDQDASPAVIVAVSAAAALALVAAGYALWLALTLEDRTPDAPGDDAPGP
jgi:hypothetical protein